MIFAIFAFACGGEKPPTNANNSIVKNTAGNNAASPTTNTNANSAAPNVSTYEIVNTFKHDSKAFTQGLVFQNGFFYESTGEYGDSTLRKVEPQTGKVLQKHEVAEDYFAEGMTILNGKIYQITWRENTAFVYD
ncbi:MAG TPA: glutaminyl-peptide cyclotransferase, partial [Pyrinomonadaceae bacterium]